MQRREKGIDASIRLLTGRENKGEGRVFASCAICRSVLIDYDFVDDLDADSLDTIEPLCRSSRSSG